MRKVGLLGGTFDPVHAGHLALAHAAQTQLGLDELRFIPAGQPWQKPTLRTPIEHRLAMLRLALADAKQSQANGHWQIDERELQHVEASRVLIRHPTYTVDTLRSLRQELGQDVSLIWLLGTDQLVNLPTWHDWESLLTLCHFAYVPRLKTDGQTYVYPPAIQALLGERTTNRASALGESASGYFFSLQMAPHAISSTQIRAGGSAWHQLAQPNANQASNLLVPQTVLDYIQQHQLYTVAL
ncbi:nicotinate (nicotinamide) nucleotide adenylyltransferase [Parvibium lacunae]|uniref:Probable nicotinate-nucleotide adenylyltransferase n=2 Tax=Parvibium lacunae TaxID=1888893 RepID=A0A368L426_9BURK|nr:nicotinate (nicotinamide) nucleotide adenylyltransferase [Parvibium lacunae]